jgi:hypothetical protein
MAMAASALVYEYLGDAPGVLLGACADISVRTSKRRLTPGTGDASGQ